MACSCCRSLELSRLLNGEKVQHHLSFKDLEACSRKDCPLCVWVKEGLGEKLQRDGVERSDYEEAIVYCYVPPYILNARNNVEAWHGFSKVAFATDIRHSKSNYDFVVELFVAQGKFGWNYCLPC